MSCGRCKKALTDLTAEYCWYCTGYLCGECWDRFGHCGHPEAEAQNERARQVPQPVLVDGRWVYPRVEAPKP